VVSGRRRRTAEWQPPSHARLVARRAGTSPDFHPAGLRNFAATSATTAGSHAGQGRERFGSPATHPQRGRNSPVTPLRNANSSATPDALSPLECCGVADKTAIFRGLPGDEFIGSLPDFLPELPCRRRAKYFFEKLVYSETCLPLQYSAFKRNRCHGCAPPIVTQGMRHHGCLQRASTPRAASREPPILTPSGGTKHHYGLRSGLPSYCLKD
jgi:hypothetical protein